MKIHATTTAAQFTITGEDGSVIASYEVGNASFTLDMAALLTNVSSLARLFNKLDATHSTPSVPVGPIGVLDRSREVQALIDALRKYRDALPRDMSEVQHDVLMEGYDILRDVREDASAKNVSDLVKHANELMGSFCEVGDKLSARVIRRGAALRAAIKAVN